MDQYFENAALEHLKQQLEEDIRKLRENDSARIREIMNERRKAATLRSHVKLYSTLFQYAKYLGRYEDLLKLSLRGVVPDDKLLEVIKGIDDLLLLYKVKNCVERIDEYR